MKAETTDIFEKGYKKAAESFSGLSGEKVSVKKFEIAFGEADDLLKKIIKTNMPQVLITDIIGEAKGRSYLVFDEHDAQEIANMLTRNMKNVKSDAAFREAILKEIDNMLSAAVITELSNALNLKIFGDVPKLLKSQTIDNEWLRGEVELMSDMLAIYSSASFSFENNVKVSPYFIWVLDQDFSKQINHKTRKYVV